MKTHEGSSERTYEASSIRRSTLSAMIRCAVIGGATLAIVSLPIASGASASDFQAPSDTSKVIPVCYNDSVGSYHCPFAKAFKILEQLQ